MENKNIQNEIGSLKQEIKKQNRALSHLISGGVFLVLGVVFIKVEDSSFFELLSAATAGFKF